MDPPLKQSQKWSISWNNPQAQKAREKQKAKGLKTKESKNSVLTDKQRAAWAHAHYIVHHGTASEAARFLTDKSNIINTPAELLGKVKVIAKMKVPTWEEAAAAVFSSSSEESSDMMTTTAATSTPAKPNPDRYSQSTTTTSQLSPILPSPSPIISGHHYPAYTRYNTSPKHPYINLSPIHPSISMHVNNTFECFHTPNKNQDNIRQPFISMMNDTYLIIHNN